LLPKVGGMKKNLPPIDSLWSATGQPGLLTLARQGQVRHYRKHMLLIQQGDFGHQIYLVVAGRLREFSMSNDSKPREITLSIWGAGQLVGAPALDGGPHCASVITLTPVVCVAVSRESALAVIQHTPAMAMDLLKMALQRVRLATETTRRALFSDAYSRLIALLQGQIDNAIDPHTDMRCQPMTHAQIAQHIGCSREMVSRIMKELINGGYVVRERDKVYRVCKRLPERW
jgi:CRP/FNR family cyclic AMP-dependent transcriptional regulator